MLHFSSTRRCREPSRYPYILTGVDTSWKACDRSAGQFWASATMSGRPCIRANTLLERFQRDRHRKGAGVDAKDVGEFQHLHDLLPGRPVAQARHGRAPGCPRRAGGWWRCPRDDVDQLADLGLQRRAAPGWRRTPGRRRKVRISGQDRLEWRRPEPLLREERIPQRTPPGIRPPRRVTAAGRLARSPGAHPFKPCVDRTAFWLIRGRHSYLTSNIQSSSINDELAGGWQVSIPT
jgi:hypothetical protein